MGFCEWLRGLGKTYKYIEKTPLYGQKGDHVLAMQEALVAVGYRITVDGSFGAQTKKAVIAFQKSFGSTGSGVVGQYTLEKLGLKVGEAPRAPVGLDNPAYLEAKKYAGKKETDSIFNKFLSGFWKIVGLPGYKTIIGTTFAWCGLFIAAMNSEVGQKWISNGAGAKNWAKYGVEIDWKKDGIPRGAVMHLNHRYNCGSGSNNHVTFADGDCTAADLKKSDAVVPGWGGNQSNQVKRSIYSVKEVCEVRWPSEIPKPAPIQKSVNCDGKADSGESTR